MEMKVKNNYDIEKIFGNRGLFADEFYYLNAERIGPRNYQLMWCIWRKHNAFIKIG